MPDNLKTLSSRLFLMEPTQLEELAVRVIQTRPCPNAREVALQSKELLEEARNAPQFAFSGDGLDHPEELQLAATGGAVRAVKGRVGVIPVYGPVDKRYSSQLMKAGGTPLEAVNASLDALLADPAVDAIVLRMDSPGGSADGVAELSDKIYAARGKKKLYCSVDGLAASAGFWLASACEKVFITPSGWAGSVGVYSLHYDESAALEQQGVKVTPVYAGKHKVEGNPWGPLDDDARKHMQEMVDHTYRQFTGALKRNRGVSLEQVREQFGEGRIMHAQDAVARGMADRVLSYEDLVLRLTGRDQGQGNQRTEAEPISVVAKTRTDVLKLRHEQRKRRVG